MTTPARSRDRDVDVSHPPRPHSGSQDLPNEIRGAARVLAVPRRDADGSMLPLGRQLFLYSRTHDVGGVVMGDSSRTPQLSRTLKLNPGEVRPCIRRSRSSQPVSP